MSDQKSRVSVGDFIKRNKALLIVAGVMVLGGAWMFYFHNDGQQARSLAPSPPRLQNSTTGEVDQVYRDLINRDEVRRVETAARTGASVVAPIQAERVPDTPKAEVVETPPRSIEISVAAPAAPTPVNVTRDPYYDQLRDRMASYLQRPLPPRGSRLINVESREQAANSAGATTASNTTSSTTGANSPNSAAPQCWARQAGKIDYVQTITATSSDRDGPILAQVVSGPFSGSRILGAFQKQDDALFIRFTSISNASGTQAIEAIAVSPETSETAVATSIDRHYFERFVLPIAAAFVQGFGQAVARSGQTVTQGVLGTTVSNPTQTTKDQLLAAAGTAGQYASQAFTENAPRGPTIHVAAGYAMGLLWLRPVPGQCQ